MKHIEIWIKGGQYRTWIPREIVWASREDAVKTGRRFQQEGYAVKLRIEGIVGWEEVELE